MRRCQDRVTVVLFVVVGGSWLPACGGKTIVESRPADVGAYPAGMPEAGPSSAPGLPPEPGDASDDRPQNTDGGESEGQDSPDSSLATDAPSPSPSDSGSAGDRGTSGDMCPAGAYYEEEAIAKLSQGDNTTPCTACSSAQCCYFMPLYDAGMCVAL